jgi:hypothetical protein
MATITKRLIGHGSVAGLGCYFRVFYTLEHVVLVAPKASPPKETFTGVVAPPTGVSLPVGKIMTLTLQDGYKVKIIANAQGEITSVRPY